MFAYYYTKLFLWYRRPCGFVSHSSVFGDFFASSKKNLRVTVPTCIVYTLYGCTLKNTNGIYYNIILYILLLCIILIICLIETWRGDIAVRRRGPWPDREMQLHGCIVGRIKLLFKCDLHSFEMYIQYIWV